MISRLFVVCTSGHLYSGACCPFDGSSHPHALALATAEKAVQQRRTDFSLSDLYAFGLNQEQLSGALVITFGDDTTRFDAVAPGVVAVGDQQRRAFGPEPRA